MAKYFLTVYDKAGAHLLNEVIEAGDDKEAKQRGIDRLKEENLLESTSRVVRSSGGLVHFHQ
ncbi:YhzD family protein [Evansella halocellulosilytica]|uniref:YhzD family protein n=1 Tax=Evansella halocellulosilytica TaxID=2011013 RepID=UPI000BB758F3|nr:YhzD family protein [Evansella halocellulosilytica]